MESERANLLVRIAEQEQKLRQLDEMLENLAAGRRADPQDVAAFRQALNEAGIAHDLLADVVEIADPSWQAAVEAVLAPSAHIVLLSKDKDTEQAMALGEKLRYRHFIVPDCLHCRTAAQGLVAGSRTLHQAGAGVAAAHTGAHPPGGRRRGRRQAATRRRLDHAPGLSARTAWRTLRRTGTGTLRQGAAGSAARTAQQHRESARAPAGTA